MKHFKFFSLFFLSIILTGCTNVDTKASENFSIDEVANISVVVQSYQLTIRESTDDQIHVKCTDKPKVSVELSDDELSISRNDSSDTDSEKDTPKVSIELSDQELLISQNDSSDRETFFGGLSFGKTGEIDIYIPESYGKSLKISNGSGELELKSLSLSEVNISNDSGYLTIENINSNTGTIVSDSGDIKLKNSFIDSLGISTDSGYVSVSNTDASSMKMHSDSGEINISSLNESCNTSIDNSSGDITVSFKSSPEDLSFNIATNSDDISCKLDKASYSSNTLSSKKGTIGDGNHSLTISSDEGTIIVR